MNNNDVHNWLQIFFRIYVEYFEAYLEQVIKEMLLKLRKIMMVPTLLHVWCELGYRDSQHEILWSVAGLVFYD